MQPARPGRLRNRSRTVEVWDPLVRLFHWGLAAGFAVAWFSEDGQPLHEYAGYAVLGLVAVRLVWGLIGGKHARFRTFVAGPAAALAYLRGLVAGRARRYLGHNPAGGLMILAMLVAVILTGTSGWLMTTAALAGAGWLEGLHELSANGTVLLIAGHLAGVVASSLVHKENLVLAMFTGRKRKAA